MMRLLRGFALIRAFGLLILFLLGPAAHASSASVIFCASYQVAYTGNTAHDDYITSNGDQLARGAKIKVTRNSDSSVISNAYSNSATGCSSSITLDTGESYTVKIIADALINGNTIQVKNTDGTAIWSSTALGSYTPPSGGENKAIVTGTHAAWNVAAAAGWAIYHQPGGLTSQTLTFWTGEAGNDFQENSGDQYSDIHNDEDKYKVGHEMGHQMSFLFNGKTADTNTLNYGADANGCPALAGGHDFNSKEYQKAAAMEGFASFYAELAFNDDSSNSDCYYHHSGEDWNLDSVVNSSDASDPSCDLGPYAYPGATSPIDPYDYLGDYCLTSGVSNNRATQYDYMRFLWDLHVKSGGGVVPLTLSEIGDVWDASDPEGWDKTGSASNTTAGNPAYELRQAAVGLSYTTSWDNWDDLDGVQR